MKTRQEPTPQRGSPDQPEQSFERHSLSIHTGSVHVYAHDPQPAGQARSLDRELSWLAFNARVLAVAADSRLPVLERAKFLAIFSHNSDEFFQVRVAGLKDRVRAGVRPGPQATMAPEEQLAAVRDRVLQLVGTQSRILQQAVLPDLEAGGLGLRDCRSLAPHDLAFVDAEFARRVFPVLTPLAIDPAQPFPYISNLSLNLAVRLADRDGGPERLARVKVPPLLPRFVALPDGNRVVPVEQIIARHLDALFPGTTIVGHHAFRVTRHADVETEEEEAEDLLVAMEHVLHRRRHSERVARLEVEAAMPEPVLRLLMRGLDLQPADVYSVDGLLDLTGLTELCALDLPGLKDEPWTPTTQPRVAEARGDAGFPAVLRAGDILVHHPYDSFATSVEAFTEQAASDPAVLAIKQTLYRTSGPESPVIRSLIRAAAAGKEVVVLVELKARFDEEANIGWARLLEEAGVHVVYGVTGLKTHAKISLVVRDEGGHIARYGHIGTGNYNPNTAHVYEDVGLLSADPELGEDLSELFNFLTGYGSQRPYRRLLVAPGNLRSRILELIGRESKDDGRIVIKVNNLADPEIVEALYQASGAGARIDLIVRSVCCLRPGLPGLSANIKVRSLIGRYLEHSRIFRFGGDDRTADYYIGSADLMPRNLDRRVEALTPVLDPALRARLATILQINLEDDALAWELHPDGTWTRVEGGRGVNTHRAFRAFATARVHGEAPPDGG